MLYYFIRLSKTCQDRGNLFGRLYVKERGETVMKNIITISREFGSGGRSIGKQVAEKLDYAFWRPRAGDDRELVDGPQQKRTFRQRSDFAPGTSSCSSNMPTPEPAVLSGHGRARHDNLSMHDQLYITQSKIIEELAEKGKCVIVGRCADYILRDRKDCLHVFICSDMAAAPAASSSATARRRRHRRSVSPRRTRSARSIIRTTRAARLGAGTEL